MKPVSFGVIGCGIIGSVHQRMITALDAAQLVAVADPVAERVNRSAETYGVAGYKSGAALLEDPKVEAVTLAMPTRQRTETARAALARGKHVLIEKPIAMNAAEVERLMAARGDLTVGCFSSRMRFTAAAKAAAECIAGGALGHVRVVHCRAMMKTGPRPQKTPPSWRLRRCENGGGILVNWGCYDLDYLLGILGWSLKPRTVLAQTWTVPGAFASHLPPDSDAETHFAALIRCEGGAVISLERAEYVASRPSNVWQIVGDAGTLQLTMIPDDESVMTVKLDRADAERGVISQTVYAGVEDADAQHAGPIEDFAMAIRQGREPATSLERALIVQRITDAVYESAATGSAVNIH